MKICASPQKLPQIASNVSQNGRDLQVRKIGKYYFAIGEYADLWLGSMSTEDGGCKLVCPFFTCRRVNAHRVVPKVALKQPRDGIVEKQPELVGRIIEVGS